MEPYWKLESDAYAEYREAIGHARRAVLSWINKEVLEYFFSKAAMDEGRRQFWNRYLTKLKMIKVAMHVGFMTRLFDDDSVGGWLRNRLVRVKVETQDIALIMDFGETTVVEFGAHGNACYIYDSKNDILRQAAAANRIDTLSDLKKTSMRAIGEFEKWKEGRLLHHQGWEDKFRHYLQYIQGIKP